MELQDLCVKIDQFLDEYTDVEKFKIGKTNNIEEREDDYHVDNYHFVQELCIGTSSDISKAEIYLTKHFREESRHKERCDNKRDGGGSPDATLLYIALKMKDASIQHLNEREAMIEKYFSCVYNISENL